ncbi:hypothetical protein [Aeromonas caviae]|uniref:hypothetical protein n=1 Tax=Aeromonas caviae TaxID=648 RepID=UPI003F745B81
MHHTERLKACLQRVICDPAFPLAELDAWFTPDYCQEVNGERLDYPAFHQHIATLRRHLAGASIEFVATLAQGERVHSTHVVRATRQDGGTLVCKVSGLFTFRGDTDLPYRRGNLSAGRQQGGCGYRLTALTAGNPQTPPWRAGRQTTRPQAAGSRRARRWRARDKAPGSS